MTASPGEATAAAYGVRRSTSSTRLCGRTSLLAPSPASSKFAPLSLPRGTSRGLAQPGAAAPPAKGPPCRDDRLRRRRATSVDDPARPHLSRGEVGPGPLPTRLGQLGSTALLLLARSHSRTRRHGADECNGDAPMAGPDPVGACIYRPRCPSRPRAAVVEAHRLRRGSDGPFNRSRSPWAAHLGGPHDRLDEETNPHASKEGRYPVSQPPRWRPPRQDRQSSSRAVFVVSRSNRRDLLVTADADLGAAFRHDLFESVKPS